MITKNEIIAMGKTTTAQDVYVAIAAAIANQYVSTGFNRKTVLAGLERAYKNRNKLLDAVPVDSLIKVVDTIMEEMPQFKKGVKRAFRRTTIAGIRS